MSSRWLVILLRAMAIVVFVAAVAWPIAALGIRLAEEGAASVAGWWPDGRQQALLGKSLALAAAASVAGVILGSLPLALSRWQGDLLGFTGVRALLAAAVLFPPMVYQFGWDRLLPAGLSPESKCMATWSLWSWPIPLAILSAGWRRRGLAVYEAARLEASPPHALVRVALPMLAREMALSLLLLFSLFFADYGVPHACGLLVYSTEILSWATSSSRIADTLAPSAAMMVIQLAVVAAGTVAATRVLRDGSGTVAPAPRAGSRHPWSAVWPVAAMFALGQALPLGALVLHAGSWWSFINSWEVHGGDLAWSAATAFVAAALVVLAAAGLLSLIPVRRRRALLTWTAGSATLVTLCLGAIPGALTGSAFIAAYNRPELGWVYDYWLILSLGFVARFAWIACLVAWLPATRGQFRHLCEQSETDGAAAPDTFRRIQLPLVGADLAVAFLIVAALSLAEVPATNLLRVPGFSPVSAVLIECFHRLEDAKLAAISIWLLAAALPAVVAMSLARRTRNFRGF